MQKSVKPWLTAQIFLSLLLQTKKREGIVGFAVLVYGCFLVTKIASTAPIMIMTMMIATSPYIRVLFEAKPLTGVAVGACVAGALLA